MSALGLRTLHHGRTCGLGRPPAFLSEDIGSLLKGGAKVCQQQLVNEVLAPLVTEFALNLGREGATPIQRAFDGSLLDRVQAVELRIRSVLPLTVMADLPKSPVTGSRLTPFFGHIVQN